ncbi:MAG: DUF4143 domain-containing protein [Desulfococcaceae bacterium]
MRSILDNETGITGVLETDIVAMVPRFSFSLKAQEKQPKKVYSIDNGLRKATAFVFSGDEGRLAENLVFQELSRAGFEVFYWKEKQEVDFIARKESETWAANVSYGDSLPERGIRGLRELGESKLKVDRKVLVTKSLNERRGEVELAPLWTWLLGSGLRE